jgi:hypothetical protein
VPTPTSNPLCPDYGSHVENVADLLFPDWTRRLLSQDEQEQVDAEALAEHLNCEGH